MPQRRNFGVRTALCARRSARSQTRSCSSPGLRRISRCRRQLRMGGASGDPMVTRPKWPSLLKPRLISILYKPRRRPCPRKTDLERSVPLDIFLPAEATDRAADGSGAPCDGGGFECDPSRCVGVVRGQRVEIDRKKLPPIPVGPLLVPPQAVLGATRTLEIVKQASIACSMARHAAPWARQRRCAKIPSHDCSPIQSSRGHIWGDIDKLTTRYVVPPNLGVGTSSAPIFVRLSAGHVNNR